MMIDFLKNSPVAEDVKLSSRIVLHRMKLSTEDLLDMEAKGSFSIQEDKVVDYELEVNGLSIARGSIVRKKGEYYFKVKEIYGEAE